MLNSIIFVLMLSVWIVYIKSTNIERKHESAGRIAKGFYSFFEPRFKVDIYRADA